MDVILAAEKHLPRHHHHKKQRQQKYALQTMGPTNTVSQQRRNLQWTATLSLAGILVLLARTGSAWMAVAPPLFASSNSAKHTSTAARAPSSTLAFTPHQQKQFSLLYAKKKASDDDDDFDDLEEADDIDWDDGAVLEDVDLEDDEEEDEDEEDTTLMDDDDSDLADDEEDDDIEYDPFEDDEDGDGKFYYDFYILLYNYLIDIVF